MWKRIELHNHTVESDGSMTVTELVRFLTSKHIRSFSLTDHNTISGWRQLRNLSVKSPRIPNLSVAMN